MKDRGIHINLGEDVRRKRGKWKGKLALYIFLICGGFAIGFFYDLSFFKDTVLEKESKIEKIQAESLALEKEIDSIKALNVELDKELNAQLAKVDSLSASDCAIFLQNRYK